MSRTTMNTTITSPFVNSYRIQLDDLNTLLSPTQLFGNIDSFIKTYQNLKREYSMEWNKHEMYDQKVRTFLRSKNPQNRSIAISIKELQVYVNKMKKLKTSLSEWTYSLTKIHQNEHNSSSQIAPIASLTDIVYDECSNIRPSHARKVSNSLSMRSSKAASPKSGKKKKQKRKKSSKKNTDLQMVQHHHYHHSHSSTSTMIVNNLDIISDEANNMELSPNGIHVEIIQNEDVFVPPPTLDRHKSVRTFGELFSKSFQVDVASNYKKSLQVQTGFFLNDDESGDKKEDSDDFINPVTSKQMKVVQYFHDNYYGQNEVFESAFGMRPVIYCDWTASGKVLECVETWLRKEMYTLYANTHTTTSITGMQTSKFRSEARSIILESLKGDVNEDVVIFTGSGVTGAIDKMSGILMKSVGKSYKPETTVVFISIYEHNSNIYIWKELGCKIIVIPENGYNKKKGGLDLKYLEKQLKFYTSQHMKHKYNLLIGSFTAASNVSGIIAPIDETTLLLHKYGALSFWDYATAGPYLDVNMTNTDNPMLSKDAIFISIHKYLAGPGAPGILCAKKKLFQNYVPVIPGGGTVFAAFGVEDGDWEYLDNIEEREEGGTPDIIGSVRAAFAFMIKDHLSTHYIEQTEIKYLKYFLEETKSCSNLVMMGNTECDRLPVLSFLITHSQKRGFGNRKTKYLHYNFIAALFNDLFGIQGRGGCSCAGMYGLQTLGMNDDEVSYVLTQMRENKNELARPGYFRINLHYTLNDKELKYIVNAVKYVCQNGWKFLPLYDIDAETGNYFHRDIKRKPNLLKKQLRSLLDISFDKDNGEMLWQQKHLRVDGKSLSDNLDKFFVVADDILSNLDEYLPNEEEFISEQKVNDEMAWYWLPSELHQDALKSI